MPSGRSRPGSHSSVGQLLFAVQCGLLRVELFGELRDPILLSDKFCFLAGSRGTRLFKLPLSASVVTR